MKKLIFVAALALSLVACAANTPTPVPPVPAPINNILTPQVQACLENYAIACAIQSGGDKAKMAACMLPATTACGVIVVPTPAPTPTPAK